MTSTITLYYNSVLLPDKNMALDNAGSGKGIGLYLSTLTSKAIANFQYVKHGLSISIRLDESQTSLAMGSGAEDLNYCKIQNGTQNPIYYFIVGKKWKSMETIELSLQMDTLNSFEYNVDYPLREKTLVYREHHDRIASSGAIRLGPLDFDEANSSWSFFYTDMFFQAGVVGDIESYTFGIYHGVPDAAFVLSSMTKTTQDGVPGVLLTGTHTAGGTIRFIIEVEGVAYRLIHKPSEDIQAPKRKTKSETLVEGYGFSWNLLYRNKDVPDDNNQYDNPVQCFLIPDVPLTIKVPSTQPIIDSGSLSSGEYMLFFPDYDPATIEFEGVRYTPYKQSYGIDTDHYAYALYNNGGTFELYSTYIRVTNDSSSTLGWWTKIGVASDPILLINPNPAHVRIVNALPTGVEMNSQQIWKKEKATTTLSLGTTGSQVILPLSSVDRTDPRNIKIIKLPYFPNDITVDGNGVVTLSPEWEFDSNANLIKLTDTDSKFVHRVKPQTDASIITPMFVGLAGQYLSQERDMEFESKLLHSDFHTPKFVYDSFPKEFHLERIDGERLAAQYIPDASFQFTFVTSRNVVSKFLFDFTQYDDFYIEETQDFNHIVCVARNNEEVLYNSQYLNYLRTGYNYDLKTKERTELTAGVGIGLNVAGLVASIGLSFIPGAQGIGIASAVASGIGLAGQLVNYAKMTAQNDQNIAQKLQEAQMQTVSVQNADDVDLLDYYCGNKAIFMEYDVSDEMEKALFDLFHYCGYKTNLQKVPDKSTRYWFNFVQADLVLVDTANLNADIEEDLKTRFKDGVTFMHYREGYGFDFAQEKENWETAIVPYLDTPEE